MLIPGTEAQHATHRWFDSVPCCTWVQRFIMRPSAFLLLIALLTALAACGGSGIVQTSQTDRYTVQLSLDGTGFGQRTATVEIADASGQPVSAADVVIAPVMEEMGMAAPEVIAQPLAPGRYQAQGELFSMIGRWRLNVHVRSDGAEEIARFDVETTQN